METKEILLKAATWLEENKWCQGRYSEGDFGKPTSCCLIGAVNMVSSGDAWFANRYTETALYYLLKFLELPRAYRYGLHTWNDASERTKEEVITLLKEAAEACKDGN